MFTIDYSIMRSLTYYYSKKDESLSVENQIRELAEQKGLLFVDICVDGDTALEQRFGRDVPVLLVGPYRINKPRTTTEVEVAINATLERDRMNPELAESKNLFQMSRMEKYSLWFSKSYVWVISIFIIAFVGFSFLPPFLMRSGHTGAANGIYGFYRLLCHQLFFRSFFIGGEQPFYPRELAGIKGVQTYEDVTGRKAGDLEFARNFHGDENLGYKVALCQRDVAIYISLALSGILFELTKRKIKPMRWYLWFIMAIIPIGLDGFSQLPGLAEGWPTWLPIRESTPFLRALTGTLFGLGTGWFMFPLMEEGMKETRFQLERKKQTSMRAAGSK